MAKLYFYYASMNAGKSTNLLQADFNYRERGMRTVLLTAAIDDRFAAGTITSRIGLAADAIALSAIPIWSPWSRAKARRHPPAYWWMKRNFSPPPRSTSSPRWRISTAFPVLAYGLRTDFLGNLFEGSARLLAIADSLIEIKSVCACGRK
ncbi:thymidine kinase, partial [Sphingomonas sp. Ant H11]|uniref:thymidine kinase n=1 Tax=Sphingomonas sp. Ant H11 TaxID=1564113 RepID=UPI001E302FFA